MSASFRPLLGPLGPKNNKTFEKPSLKAYRLVAIFLQISTLAPKKASLFNEPEIRGNKLKMLVFKLLKSLKVLSAANNGFISLTC